MSQSRFSWSEPVMIEPQKQKIAAVNPQTHMIEHIYSNVVVASKALSNKNQNYYAKEIGKALQNYHYKALGYWWKRIY